MATLHKDDKDDYYRQTFTPLRTVPWGVDPLALAVVLPSPCWQPESVLKKSEAALLSLRWSLI